MREAEKQMQMQPAGPEIIRCQNCKWSNEKNGSLFCKHPAGYVDGTDDDFGCILAERREDTAPEALDVKEQEIDARCQDCEAYLCYKNGIHAKCPIEEIWDACSRADKEDAEAWGWE